MGGSGRPPRLPQSEPAGPAPPAVILASASPRRRELLSLLCADFAVAASEIDESATGPWPPAEVARRLALGKARAVAARLERGLVLGADTLVVVDGEALGKPADRDSARAMLRRLRGRWHEVTTGVAVVDAASDRQASVAVTSRVLMADYPDACLEAYIGSGAPLDKAGGYAIQDLWGRLVVGVIGSYSNVVGLPLPATRQLLAELGAPLSSGPAV